MAPKRVKVVNIAQRISAKIDALNLGGCTLTRSAQNISIR